MSANPISKEQWLAHVAQWRASGITHSAYCAQHGLKLHNLIYWIKRCREQTDCEAKLTLMPGKVAKVLPHQAPGIVQASQNLRERRRQCASRWPVQQPVQPFPALSNTALPGQELAALRLFESGTCLPVINISLQTASLRISSRLAICRAWAGLCCAGQAGQISSHSLFSGEKAMIMRRTVLKSVVAGTALSVYAGTVGGLQAFAQSGLRVRRSLHDMKLDDPDLATYRDFVKWMKSQDQKKALSWLGYANQHGSLLSGYKYCPHGDWYFLPWHRGFVLMYEQAAASLMKNPAFAMPYWDWTLDRSVPEAFANPTYNNAANPLYVATRRNNLVLSDDIVGQSVMDQVYADTPFQKFGTSKNPQQNNTDPSWVPAGGGTQGTLEGTPHNLVHNSLGGFMPTPASPRDPIFMMHHSNIDRIWANWNAMGNQNETDTLWLTMNFQDNYLRPDGTPYSMKVSDLVSTNALGYTYQDLAAAKNITVNASRNQNLLDMLAGKKKPNIKRSQVAAKAKLVADRLFMATSKLAEHNPKSVLGEGAAAKEAFAILTDVQLGEKTLGVRIFVNLEGAADPQIPISNPHFVNTISFLAHKKVGAHAHHKAPPAAAVDLTPTLRKLAAANLLKGDKISVQLLPVPMPGTLYEDATMSVGSVEIVLI